MQNSDSKKTAKAIIIPAVTDVNRGDQALVWEAASLIKETVVCDDVLLLDGGETDQESELQGNQTRRLGYDLVAGIMPHPRRGRYSQEDKIKERKASFISIAMTSMFDYLWSQLVIIFAPFPKLVGLLLNERRYQSYLAFREAPAVVVKGGGFLHAYGDVTATYYIWYQLFYFRLAQRLNKPVIVLPNSYGPFEGVLVKPQMKGVFSKCLFVSAREAISAKMLADVAGIEVPVYPDLGYYLKSKDSEIGREVCQQFDVPLGEKPCVAMTLRPYRFPGFVDPTASFKQYIDGMAKLVRHLSDKGFYPVFVTHVAGPSSHENDRLAIAEVRSRLEGVEHSWIDFEGDCYDVQSVYSCMDYLIGTRFHSVIFAQNSNVPCLAIAYGGNKSVGIMNDMGLGDYVTPIEDVTDEILCAQFDQLVENTDEVKQRMTVWQQRAWAERQEIISKINSRFKQWND